MPAFPVRVERALLSSIDIHLPTDSLFDKNLSESKNFNRFQQLQELAKLIVGLALVFLYCVFRASGVLFYIYDRELHGAMLVFVGAKTPLR